MTKVGGIVLAAGASRRAPRGKATAEVEGETFVARAVRVLREGGCAEVIVLVGPPHGEAVASAVPGVRTVTNPAPARGMLSSLRLGISAAQEAGWRGAVLALVDHPHVRATTVSTLIERLGEGSATVIHPRYAGRRGHPIAISSEAFAEIVAAEDERTTREVIAAIARHEDVEVSDAAVLEDLDEGA